MQRLVHQGIASVHVAQSPVLLSSIFSHLQPPVSSPTHALSVADKKAQKELRGTLFCLACVSRVFAEHALAILWLQIDDVRHLLRLFTQFRPCYRGSQVSLLHEDITPEAWLRFQAYASRVRVLHQETWTKIHSSTWSFLLPWCGHQPLFPKLVALSTLPILVSDPVMMMFLTPTLRRLHIGTLFGRRANGDDCYAITSILGRISRRAPAITELRLIHDDNYNSLLPTFLHPIRSFAGLQVFEAENAVLDLPILQWLAKLDNLHTLSAMIELEHDESDDSDEESEWFHDSDWSSLTRLSIRGRPWDLMTFVSRMHSPPILSLTLEVVVECWPEELTTLVAYSLESFEYVGEPIRLEEFTLRYKHDFRRKQEHQVFSQEPHPMPSLLDIVGYSLYCSNIKKAVFDLTELPALTDADLEQMVESWHDLTSLHIPPSERTYFHVHSSNKIARPTMSSLIVFARRCPQLQELSLPEMRLSTLPKEDENWPMFNHPLRALLIGFEGDNNQCLRGATFIDGLFPSVDLLDPPPRTDHWSSSRHSRDQDPESVKEYLDIIRLGRRRRELLKKLSWTDPRAGQATAVLW